MNKQDFLNENYGGKFPISANTFDFMQSQTEFVSKIAAAFGNNVILKKPTTNNRDGLIVIDGELLPLQYTSLTTGYFRIIETKESIVAQNTEYTDARITRYASLVANQTSYPKASFVDLTGGNYPQQTTLANHFLPKGAIIMWSGSWNEIPVGFALCNGNNGAAINGVTIPDLRGRFIVGGNSGDTDFAAAGQTGGSKTHTLTVEEIPSHSHNVNVPGRGAKNVKGGSNDHWHLDNDNTIPTESTGGGQPFKHLPPYYVMAFLIKVI